MQDEKYLDVIQMMQVHAEKPDAQLAEELEEEDW